MTATHFEIVPCRLPDGRRMARPGPALLAGAGLPWDLVAILLLLGLGGVLGRGEAPPESGFRIGVSYGSFGTVGRNDAGAALKAWATTVVRERRLSFPVHVELFDTEPELTRALEKGRVDAASMTAAEFLTSGSRPEHVILTAMETGHFEQYVLVARREVGARTIADLRGQRLVRYDSPRAGVAWPWLETALASSGLGGGLEFWSATSVVDKPSKAVLRVFFRQAEACLVTTNAFRVACELNPQIARSLQVLLTSPPIVPTLMFFRSGYSGQARTDIEQAILALHETTAGKQVLTVFQGTRMVKEPVSCLDATRRVLEEHERIFGRRPGQGQEGTSQP